MNRWGSRRRSKEVGEKKKKQQWDGTLFFLSKRFKISMTSNCSRLKFFLSNECGEAQSRLHAFLDPHYGALLQVFRWVQCTSALVMWHKMQILFVSEQPKLFFVFFGFTCRQTDDTYGICQFACVFSWLGILWSLWWVSSIQVWFRHIIYHLPLQPLIC